MKKSWTEVCPAFFYTLIPHKSAIPKKIFFFTSETFVFIFFIFLHTWNH